MFQRLTGAFPGHFYQAQFRYLSNLGLGMVTFQHALKLFHYFFTMLRFLHINEINDRRLKELMEKLKQESIEATVAYAFTVQEEVGLRGAKTAAYKIKPDLALAVDVTMSNDIPGVPKQDTALGKGVALSVMDGSVIAHRGLLDVMEKVAVDANVPYTFDMMTAGGTDAGEIHKQYEGVITMTLSIPSRYFHSHVSVIDSKDVDATIDLIVAFLRQFNATQLDQLKMSKFL
jgi:putative aminopeptidase FrvX